MPEKLCCGMPEVLCHAVQRSSQLARMIDAGSDQLTGRHWGWSRASGRSRLERSRYLPGCCGCGC